MNNNIRGMTAAKTLMTAAALIAGFVVATPAMADGRRHTTVIRETVYHSPSRVIVEPAIVLPISDSIYLGIGSHNTYRSHTTRSHTTVVREVHRERNHPVWGYHPGRGHAHGHHTRSEPVRGRWSGADRRREVIYVDRDGRRGSSYREAERHSVIIRDRSR